MSLKSRIRAWLGITGIEDYERFLKSMVDIIDTHLRIHEHELADRILKVIRSQNAEAKP